MRSLPLPGTSPAVVVSEAPAPGPQRWAGAPSATFGADGSIVLAYRVRGDTDVNVIARSGDGEHFHTLTTITKEQFGASMVERPAIVRTPPVAGACMSAVPPLCPHTGGSA